METAESVDPTQAAAELELSRLEAAEGIAPAATPEPGSANSEQTAPVPDEVATTDTAEPTADADTPATADLPTTDDKQTTDKQQTKDTKSSFAKSIERGFTNWKEFNEWKATERARIEAETTTLKQEREALQRQKPAPLTPERYQASAEGWEARAALLEKRAGQAEEAGQYDEAEKLREESAELNLDAKRARRTAEELAKNPPAELQQSQAATEAHRKEWYSKAQIDYPNAARPGTPEAQALKTLTDQNPEILKPENADQMYWACRLVSGETAAARVPTLTRQVSDLTAKVKELEGKLQISSETVHGRTQGSVPFEQMSTKEQEAQLEREAAGLPQHTY